MNLKLCPFCSGKPKALGCHVYCEDCFVATTIYDTQAEAAEAWNRRAPSEVEYLFDDDGPQRTYTVRR